MNHNTLGEGLDVTVNERQQTNPGEDYRESLEGFEKRHGFQSSRGLVGRIGVRLTLKHRSRWSRSLSVISALSPNARRHENPVPLDDNFNRVSFAGRERSGE